MMPYQSFVQIQQKILHILLGLNRVYYFGFKWLDVVIGRLSIAPVDLGRRLREVYHLPVADGAQRLVALVEESYSLIEEHLPPVDVTWLRSVFHYRRPLWDGPPPLP